MKESEWWTTYISIKCKSFLILSINYIYMGKSLTQQTNILNKMSKDYIIRVLMRSLETYLLKSVSHWRSIKLRFNGRNNRRGRINCSWPGFNNWQEILVGRWIVCQSYQGNLKYTKQMKPEAWFGTSRNYYCKGETITKNQFIL